MKKEYDTIIAELDKTLSLLRRNWLEAPAAEKEKFMARINSALDERMRLMSLRDTSDKI